MGCAGKRKTLTAQHARKDCHEFVVSATCGLSAKNNTATDSYFGFSSPSHILQNCSNRHQHVQQSEVHYPTVSYTFASGPHGARQDDLSAPEFRPIHHLQLDIFQKLSTAIHHRSGGSSDQPKRDRFTPTGFPHKCRRSPEQTNCCLVRRRQRDPKGETSKLSCPRFFQ